MALYPTIFCAIDFSVHSRTALRIALDLASRAGSRVIAFHTIDLLLAQAAAAVYDDRRLREDAEAELRNLVRSMGASQAVRDVVVDVGRPEQAIVAAARERHADLIVMGTQGLGGLRKVFFGSVTEKVLRESEIPVLAARADGYDGTEAWCTGVVAAVEFDGTLDAVVRHARAFCDEFDLPLTLVHVVRPLRALPQYTDALGAAQEARIQEARARLEEVAATRGDRRRVGTEVRTGAPDEEIAAAASASPGRIVVIGTGGGRMLHRPGSTAYRVLSLSSCPVLAVP
ncbi:MAG TPA: universal stress protein [Vicinamibacterales bacterium]|nr:universal stress protein [Vicinamibacterales bacterium]